LLKIFWLFFGRYEPTGKKQKKASLGKLSMDWTIRARSTGFEPAIYWPQSTGTPLINTGVIAPTHFLLRVAEYI
tara:strand:+ start:883 stop:1104 length:222 start_codon:yes stop_codon:yes gene_type:complete